MGTEMLPLRFAQGFGSCAQHDRVVPSCRVLAYPCRRPRNGPAMNVKLTPISPSSFSAGYHSQVALQRLHGKFPDHSAYNYPLAVNKNRFGSASYAIANCG